MPFRLDRFLSLYFFHPLAKQKTFAKPKIPILMYHGISDPVKNNLHPYYETSTSRKNFIKHIRWLKDNEYKTIFLQDISEIFSGNRSWTEKIVAITFDDGLLDFYDTAFPILESNGYKATVFLPTSLMGKTLAEQHVMTWQNARELAAAGVNFGSHSMSHSKLVDLERCSVRAELWDSKQKIEDELGQAVKFFSYPYAFPEQDVTFVRDLEELLIINGYEGGVTTKIGRVSDKENPLFLKRLPVNHHDNILFFKAKIEGGYDWLHTGQNIFKRFKSIVRANK